MPKQNYQPEFSDNWPQVQEDDPRKLKELEAVYARVFMPGSDGFVVFGDLMARYLWIQPPSTANHDFFAGSAAVLKHIQMMIVRGQQ